METIPIDFDSLSEDPKLQGAIETRVVQILEEAIDNAGAADVKANAHRAASQIISLTHSDAVEEEDAADEDEVADRQDSTWTALLAVVQLIPPDEIGQNLIVCMLGYLNISETVVGFCFFLPFFCLFCPSVRLASRSPGSACGTAQHAEGANWR